MKQKYTLNSFFQEVYQDNIKKSSLNENATEDTSSQEELIENTLAEVEQIDSRLAQLEALEARIQEEKKTLNEGAASKIAKLKKFMSGDEVGGALGNVLRNKKSYAIGAGALTVGNAIGDARGTKKGIEIGKKEGEKTWQQKMRDLVSSDPEDIKRAEQKKREEKSLWSRIMAKEIFDILGNEDSK